MQKKKGISLIVLVITIIVMIILAAAIILSLNNAGIIGNANKAVEMTDEANVKQIAQLGWSDAYIEHREDVAKLREGVETALVDSGLNPDDYGMIVTTKGVEITKGWLQDKTTVVKGDTKLTVGDTINYDEGIDSYNAGWKILGAENGELLIMSADNVSTLALGSTTDLEKAKTDYITGIQQLSDICIPYGKGRSATGARSINVDDINRVTGYNPSSEKYEEEKIGEYGNEVTYYWDGTAAPYYEGRNGKYGNLIDSYGQVIHNGEFIYFNGTEFVISKLTDEENAGASATNKKKITTLETDQYVYYPRTLAKVDNENYPTKGIETTSKSYKMLFRNVDNTENVSYWLASSMIWTYDSVLCYGMRRVNAGSVVSQILVKSNVGAAGTTHGVRAVVKLNKDITLTGNSTDGWSY